MRGGCGTGPTYGLPLLAEVVLMVPLVVGGRMNDAYRLELCEHLVAAVRDQLQLVPWYGDEGAVAPAGAGMGIGCDNDSRVSTRWEPDLKGNSLLKV